MTDSFSPEKGCSGPQPSSGTLKNFDITARLGEIDVPTLFLTGEFDEARPETVEGFAEAVPGARFEMLPGVGHAGPTRVPDFYRQLIGDFIKEGEIGDQKCLQIS